MIDLRLKYGTNNIPILSNETIDEHAELLIGDYDSSLLSQPQAVDVEDFAENYLGCISTLRICLIVVLSGAEWFLMMQKS